jgi:hypothetical protein
LISLIKASSEGLRSTDEASFGCPKSYECFNSLLLLLVNDMAEAVEGVTGFWYLEIWYKDKRRNREAIQSSLNINDSPLVSPCASLSNTPWTHNNQVVGPNVVPFATFFCMAISL